MWNFKNLIIAIVFAVCAIVCAVSFLFLNGGSITSGFMLGRSDGNTFAPTGAVIFAFISFLFFKNARR